MTTMPTKPILPTPTPITTITAADLAFEREKAAITSYEEGWDRWDGPIYPVGHVQCRMQEDGYVAPRKVEGGKGVEVKALEISAE